MIPRTNIHPNDSIDNDLISSSLRTKAKPAIKMMPLNTVNSVAVGAGTR